MNEFQLVMVVCQIPLSLPAEVDVDRHKDCDMFANQSRRSNIIYSVLPRDMHAATVMSPRSHCGGCVDCLALRLRASSLSGVTQ